MKTCFVIQRFDGDIYDRRYRETFAPAIQKAGAKPVRADEVLGTKPVVEKIEQGLRTADIAFAEISEDNANVFLELGFALALGVPTVIVCDKGRRQYLPFDIAHRPVLFYSTNAQSDYERISVDVTKAAEAALLESDVAPPQTAMPHGSSLDIDEVKSACLTTLLDQSLRSPVGSALWEINKEVARQHISERMVALAVASLLDDGLIQKHAHEENGEPYLTYSVSDQGQKYILRSYTEIMMKERELAEQSQERALVAWEKMMKRPAPEAAGLDDDIPF